MRAGPSVLVYLGQPRSVDPRVREPAGPRRRPLDEVLRSAPVTSWAGVQARIAYLEDAMLTNEDDPARIDQVKQIGADVAQMLDTA